MVARTRSGRRFLKLLGATVAGLLLGVAITAVRLVMIAPTPREELTATLDNNPLFQLAIRSDPALRQQYLARLEQAYARGGVGGSAAEANAIGKEIGRALAPALLPVAPDAVLSDYLAVTTDYLVETYQSNPDECYAFARGQAAGGGLVLPVDIRARLSNVMENVLAAASSNPVTMSADEWAAGRAKVEEIRARIVDGAEADRMYFGDFAGKPAATPAERKGTCLFLTRVYQDLGRTDVPLRYQALRALTAPPPETGPRRRSTQSI